jgi:hypothetical protein
MFKAQKILQATVQILFFIWICQESMMLFHYVEDTEKNQTYRGKCTNHFYTSHYSV